MFVKLFSSILQSSVWDEAPTTKLVWITMLLLADEDGFVKGVESAIARSANVSREDCRTAIRILEEPDLDSQSQEYGGRRIERVEGGWQVLNYKKYREYRTREQVKAADRQRRKYNADKQLQRETPVAPREEREVSRSSASLSASVSGSSVREKFNPASLAAYSEFAAGHRRVGALDAAIERAAVTYSWPVIGQALVDMLEAGARFSPRTLVAFARGVRRVAAPTNGVGPAAHDPKPWCAACGGEPNVRPSGRFEGMRHKADCALKDVPGGC